MTVPLLRERKNGDKIAMVTAYDWPSARLADQAGVDTILVGDSLGMVVAGHPNTLPVTLDAMIYHAEMVGRAVERALVIVDLPFPKGNLGPTIAAEAAARIIQETTCQAVKIEGGADRAPTIQAVVSADIPVVGHIGLLPQKVHIMGGYKTARDEAKLLEDARAIEQAGAFAIVLECVPADIAAKITQSVNIPTIGIGAGPSCDGQVLVYHDLLGLSPSGFVPSHARQYADLSSTIREAIGQYVEEVRTGKFPEEG